jgi:hypothetical protein
MIEQKPQEVDTTKTQKKQGYFEIRRLKLIKLNASEIIGADIKTSESGNRIELSRKNEIGFPSEGLYLYNGGKIATALSQNTIAFFDNDGAGAGVIQMPTAGSLGIVSTNILVNAQSGSLSLVGGDAIRIDSDIVILPKIPSSPSGLPPGAIYSDGGTLKIV